MQNSRWYLTKNSKVDLSRLPPCRDNLLPHTELGVWKKRHKAETQIAQGKLQTMKTQQQIVQPKFILVKAQTQILQAKFKTMKTQQQIAQPKFALVKAQMQILQEKKINMVKRNSKLCNHNITSFTLFYTGLLVTNTPHLPVFV